MTRPKHYERWYHTPRGRWIGRRELELVLAALAPRPGPPGEDSSGEPLVGESLLDVGCGTGFFTREVAGRVSGKTVGIDSDPERVGYARRLDPEGASYAVADARDLPFPDGAFDLVVSITALCFIDEESTAAREIVRLARRRFAVGLLNRHSLLWMQKGRGGGSGGYRGARWHSPAEARALFSGLPVRNLRVQTAIHLHGGSRIARLVERVAARTLPALPTGAFLLISGDVDRG